MPLLYCCASLGQGGCLRNFYFIFSRLFLMGVKTGKTLNAKSCVLQYVASDIVALSSSKSVFAPVCSIFILFVFYFWR